MCCLEFLCILVNVQCLAITIISFEYFMDNYLTELKMRIIALLAILICFNSLTVNAASVKNKSVNVENLAQKSIADKLLYSIVMQKENGFSVNSAIHPLICKSSISNIKFGSCKFNVYSPTSYVLIGKASDGDLVYIVKHDNYKWKNAVKIRINFEEESYCVFPGEIFIDDLGCYINPWQDSVQGVEDNVNPWK